MQRICRPNHKKEQLIREIWKTEFGIKELEDVLIRNKILIPTETEDGIKEAETSEIVEPKTTTIEQPSAVETPQTEIQPIQTQQQENTVEQELDNGLKLVKTPDGQYNIMTEDRKMLMTKNNTREDTLGIYKDLKKEGLLEPAIDSAKERQVPQQTQQDQQSTTQATTEPAVSEEQPIATTQPTAQTEGGNITPPPSDNTPPSTPNPLAHPSENVDTVNKVAISEDITKPKKSRWQEFKRKYINSMVEVENFLKGKVKSPETVTHNAKLSSSIASDWVENGVSRVVEKNGKTVVERKSKSFIKLFDFLRGKGKEYKRQYFDYLLHKHNVSRMDIPFKVVATQEQINVLSQALEKNEISQKLYDTLTNTENETKCSEVRNLVLEHEDLMSENTLNTVLELMGEQKPVFGKEVTFEDSERKVAEYERTNPEFKQHAKDIYEYNRALLERQVEEGIITKETRDRFNEMYPNYVPTHRLQYGQSNAGIKKGTIQSGIKSAKGSDLVIMPIDQQIFYQTQIVSKLS